MLPQSTVDPPQLARGTRRNNKIQLEKWTKGENRYLTQEDTRMAKEPGEDAGQCRSLRTDQLKTATKQENLTPPCLGRRGAAGTLLAAGGRARWGGGFGRGSDGFLPS